MRAGGIVHVPSNVILVREMPLDETVVLTKYLKTSVPKKALVLRELSNTRVVVEYGEYSWTVRKKDITLLEFESDY